MADVFSSGLRWFEAAFKGNAGSSVGYQFGAGSVSLTAVIGETPVGSQLEKDVLMTWRSQDFLVQAADLVDSSGAAITPTVGHALTSNGNTFRVAAASDGRCFRYTDPTRRTLRIHTKELGTT